MVFGFGGPSLKGCTARVTLTKTEFYPGEVVHGRLALSVKDPVECLRFTVGLVGCESLAWQETSTSDTFPSEVGNVTSQSSTTTHDYDVSHEIFRREVSLLDHNQAVIPPGEHVYPFELLLHTALPGTHETIPFAGGDWLKIRSSILYKVQVNIHQKGAKKPKDVVNRPFVLRSLPLSPAKHPARPIMDVEETPIAFFCCFRKGLCKMTLRTDRDTVDINNGVIPLVVSIANETSLTVKSLTVSIHQTLLVHVPDGPHNAAFTTTPQLVRAQVVNETIAPHSTKEGIQLTVPMARFGIGFRSGKAANSPLVPSCDVRFASVVYHVRVELEYIGRFLTTVLAVIPVKLLNIPEAALPVSTAPAPMPEATATVTPLPGTAPVDVTVELASTKAAQECGEALSRPEVEMGAD